MGNNRLELSQIFRFILGSKNVYFQPPPTVQMNYPCIKYERSNIRTHYADNIPYKNKKRYTVTIIDKNPDSVIPDKVGQLPTASYERFYTADGLNHDVYTIYY